MINGPNRRPAGTPAGGQFAPGSHAESSIVLDVPDAPKAAPLERFRVVGVEERTFKAAPDAPTQAAGSCWHCGASIRICVLARNDDTGETVSIGTTCAERIGLDPAGLKRYLAERFAEERAMRSKAGREAAARAAERWEQEQATAHGPHGAESRFLAGCRCEDCCDAAPHGSLERFRRDRCVCGPCLDAALESEHRILTRSVLVDLATGRVVPDARAVSGQYGTSWFIPSRHEFVPFGRKRRATIAQRGYTYAEASFIGYDARGDGRSDRVFVPMTACSEPCLDAWGEPIRPTCA